MEGPPEVSHLFTRIKIKNKNDIEKALNISFFKHLRKIFSFSDAHFTRRDLSYVAIHDPYLWAHDVVLEYLTFDSHSYFIFNTLTNLFLLNIINDGQKIELLEQQVNKMEQQVNKKIPRRRPVIPIDTHNNNKETEVESIYAASKALHIGAGSIQYACEKPPKRKRFSFNYS